VFDCYLFGVSNESFNYPRTFLFVFKYFSKLEEFDDREGPDEGITCQHRCIKLR